MQRSCLFLLLLALIAALTACGSEATLPDSDTGSIVNPSPTLDTDDPFAGLSAAELEDGIRTTSAVYTRYFLDAVNQHSHARWDVLNNGGPKDWGLSNTAYSAPKSFIVGGNYWRNEDDTLTSMPFVIPADKPNVRFSFHSRWQIDASDSAVVQISYNDGADWEDLATFTGASNPSYPNWDRYKFFLPEAATNRTTRLRFQFNSDNANHGWGIGVDSVAVYQTQLDPPVNFTATPQSNGAKLLWDHAPAGTRPATYSVERADTYGGTYTELDTVDFPARQYLDLTAVAGQGYWYRVTAQRDGFSSPPATASISGSKAYDAGTWTSATIAAANGSHESSAAIINGNPAVAFKHSDGSIHYVRSSTPDGTSDADWGSSAQIYAGTFALRNVHMLNAGGTPGIAFLEEGDEDPFNAIYGMVHYFSSTDPDGAGATWSDHPITDAGWRMLDMCAGVVGGRPAVGWCQQGEDSLIQPTYSSLWAADAAGNGWAGTGTSSVHGAQNGFIGDIDGLCTSYVFYYEDSDPEQINDGTTFQRDGGTFRYHGDVPFGSDLAVLDAGSTVFTFHDGLSANRSSDAGESWAGDQALGFTSGAFDARLVDGKPAVVYANDAGVWYVSALDADATLWSPPQLVAAAPAYWPGARSAQWLLDIGGQPAVLWSDGLDIHFALRSP